MTTAVGPSAKVEPSATVKPSAAAERVRRDEDEPLRGALRLRTAALGIDAGAPDFAERLLRAAVDNEPYHFEYSAQKGELIVMPPSGWETHIGENGVSARVAVWRDDSDTGYASGQTVMFRLPDGSVYMPDAAWITQERYDALRAGAYTSVIPGAPDFVVEVRSRTDDLARGLAKMAEWMAGGTRLGWYIDPYQRRVYIYRAGQAMEVRDNPQTLSGEDVLPGFVFEVGRLVFDRYADAGV